MSMNWYKVRLKKICNVPDTVTYVPADLERDSLADALRRGGLTPDRPALVSWLGVVMYLTAEAIGETLATIGGLAPGSEIVLDHLLPTDLRDDAGREYADAVAAVAAEGGEPWLSQFRPPEMAALLAGHRLEVVRQVGQRDMVDAALWRRGDALRPAELFMIAHARRGPGCRVGR